MALRIGTQEVQALYLGATSITELFISNENIAPTSTPALQLEQTGYLLTEDNYKILLETNTPN